MNGAVFHIARVSLEAETALSIVSGQASGVFDSCLVVDANDLPAIPGSALAGVLRSLYRATYKNEDETKQLFGFQSERGDEESQVSRLHVSWGCIQDSGGKAVQGLCFDNLESLKKDAILKPAFELVSAPVSRDRVKINHKGVSANTGKFDRAVLPAGYRFTLELSMWAESTEPETWKKLLALLKHPLLRLGGMTRAGLGKMKLVQAHQKVFDLRQEQARTRFTKLSRDLNNLEGFEACKLSAIDDQSQFVTANITLKPNGHWRIGQGSESGLGEHQDKPANLLPKLEETVLWSAGRVAEGGTKQLLIPASSVKGALSHRIAYHANRLKGVWAEDVLPEKQRETTSDQASVSDEYDKSEHCEAVRDLFGFANDNGDAETPQNGRAGFVFIDDAYQAFSAKDLQVIMHNSIDRFSGSVRDHMLFSEEMVWGKGINIQLVIQTDRSALDDEGQQQMRQALALSLEDLCQGRLALGAGSAKGHGFFTGDVVWSDNQKWLKEGV